MKKYAKLFEIAILVLALAIPAWLFYNFWGKRAKKGVASRPMVTVPVSSVAKSTMAASVPPVQAPAPVQPAGAASAKAMPVHVSSPVVSAASAPLAPQPVATPAQPVAHETPAAKDETAVSTGPLSFTFSLAKGRNPFLSPDDFAKIEAIKEAKRQAELDAIARDNANKKKQIKDSMGASPDDIELQGIIGEQAIINRRTLMVGQMVDNAKLMKVGQDYVVLRIGYKNYYFNMDGKWYELDRQGRRVR